jgi:threonine dehydrogenase-like Zn-dependent dehydrogenase
MDAWVLYQRKDLRLEKRPLPGLNNDEVLIKVRQAGICGSDLHYYRIGKVGEYIPSQPFILGHEFSGDVIEVGSEVKGLKKLDRVGVDPSIRCDKCEYCRSGQSNLCINMKFLGSGMYVPPIDGAFREFIVMPEKNCFKLPDEIGYAEGALLEPMSVAFYALKRAGNLKGKSVLISGGGTIGQLLLSFAIALGAEKVCLSDPVPSKRELAKKRGAFCTIDPTQSDFMDKTMEMIPDGFNIAIEASGSIHAVRQGFYLTKKGGTIVQVGILPPEEAIPLGLICFKELNYIGSFRYCNIFEEILTMYSSGKFNVKELISQVYPFKELDKAIASAGESKDTIKIQIKY